MSVSLTNSLTFESFFDSPGLPPFRGPRRNNKPGVNNTKIIIPGVGPTQILLNILLSRLVLCFGLSFCLLQIL